MIPLSNNACSSKIISKGRKKDILLDIYRDDIAYS